MKVQLTIPDGPFADAVMIEAAKHCQTEASLCLSYVRTMVNKYGYKIPLTETSRRKHAVSHLQE